MKDTAFFYENVPFSRDYARTVTNQSEWNTEGITDGDENVISG